VNGGWAYGHALRSAYEWDPPSPSLRRNKLYETHGTNETPRIAEFY
jgi:hypothetical protein